MTFNEPGATESVFRTETRAVATDVMARTRFRRYWSLLSPGTIVIRRMMLQPLKAEAERRAAGRRAADSDRVAPVAAESLPDEARGPADARRRLQP